LVWLLDRFEPNMTLHQSRPLTQQQPKMTLLIVNVI
jgi:hypothetical protein